MFRFILTFLLLFGCGQAPKASSSARPYSIQLASEYSSLVATVQSEADQASGWPSSHDCDGALWAGEARAAGIESVRIEQALQPDGRPTRRPLTDCPLSETSHSTSTDMQLGIILGLFASRDCHSLARLQAYAEDHKGEVGYPSDTLEDLAYTYVKPGTRTLLALTTEKSGMPGGKGSEPWRHLPIAYTKPPTDSTLHLSLLSLYVEKELGTFGVVNQHFADSLCASNPEDALALAVCGRLREAAERVLSSDWTPPSYVRGSPNYLSVHKAFILYILLREGK